MLSGMSEASGFEQHRYVPPPTRWRSLSSAMARPSGAAGKRFPLIDGQGDPALSEVGEGQASSVARELADERFSGAFVSNLRRTQETAAPLAESSAWSRPCCRTCARSPRRARGRGYRIKVAEGDPLVVEVAARNAGT